MRKIVYFFLDILGINALFRFINRHEAIILWYHGVCADDFTLLKGYDERHIPQALFRKQLKFLKSCGYTFATMTELMDTFAQGKNAEKFVVLTFDDGFRNIVDNAYPVMQKLGAKGCFYLVAGLIGTDQLLWTDHIEMFLRSSRESEFKFIFQGKPITYTINTKDLLEAAMRDIKKKLRTISDKERKEHLRQFVLESVVSVPKEFLFASWEQIKKLDKNVLEVGCHTQNHPNCEMLDSDEEFREELLNSKRAIENKVGYDVKHFCYPAGSFNAEVIRHVKEYGYQSAATIIPGFNNKNTDPYVLKRISIEEDFIFFKAITSGSYFFISRLVQRLKGR